MNEPSSQRPSLSIIIPAYNEARRLGRSLPQIRQYAVGGKTAVELIVVDDGSNDGTAEVVERFDPGPMSVVVLRNDINRGKGYSVRRGMLAAAGSALLMTDADLSVPIGEVEKLLTWLDRGCDVAIGSRDMPESILSPPQPLYRRLMGIGFRAVRRTLMLRDIRDSQCGFKCFRRDVAREVFAMQKTDGFAFDCEVLALARRLGYRIREVGVAWCDDPEHRIRLVRDSIGMLVGLFKIRWRLRHVSTPSAADVEG